MRYLLYVRYTPEGRWHFRHLSDDLLHTLAGAAEEEAMLRNQGNQRAETSVWAAPYPGSFTWSFVSAPEGWKPMVVQ